MQQEIIHTVTITFAFSLKIIFAQNLIQNADTNKSVEISHPCALFNLMNCAVNRYDECLINWIKWLMEYDNHTEPTANTTQQFTCLPFLEVSHTFWVPYKKQI